MQCFLYSFSFNWIDLWFIHRRDFLIIFDKVFKKASDTLSLTAKNKINITIIGLIMHIPCLQFTFTTRHNGFTNCSTILICYHELWT